MELPGKSECCWIACAPETAYPSLRASANTEVAIVGAGIVGLSAAYVLARASVPVTVLEARKIGRQVTGRSTAKITSQHALIFGYLIRKFGLDFARLYADANQNAVAQICRWIAEARIDCDLER